MVFNICIFYIIIYKFSYKEKIYLIILFLINKNLKINFYYIILFFNLTINIYI